MTAVSTGATQGVCTNLPEACALAASRQLQPLDAGQGRCSACGATLMAPAAGAAAPARPLLRAWPLLLGLLLGLLAAGWLAMRWAGGAATATTATTAASAPESMTHPVAGKASVTIRLHGSNTVGATLAPALARAFLSREGYDQIDVRDGADAEERVVSGRRPADGDRIDIEVAAHGTATAFTALAEGRADIGMASRPIRADERTATQALGDLAAEGSEYVVALDGVAVIVHPSNPLQRLTIEQIRQLFSGQVSDWSALGAPAGPVHLHARDDRSGTWDTFRALVLDKVPLAATATRHEDSRVLSDAVSVDPQAIGFIGLPYVRSAKTLAVADGRAEPLRPSRFTVATEDYALSRRLHFYVARDAQPLARKLADFAVSEAGQQIAQTSGFVGQIPDAEEGGRWRRPGRCPRSTGA